MKSLGPGACAVVVGASGGIGAALVQGLLDDPAFETVIALARGFDDGTPPSGKLRHGHIDITDEASIAEASERIGAPPRLAIVATGALHGPASAHAPAGLQPEKSYRSLDADALMESYRLNAVGPALVAKHMLPLMPAKGRAVFAALSARVGSIGDNRTGGWHAYRASKAALNMIVRNLALETARRNPELLCVGLHPGTVDTALSRPFQRGVSPERLFTPGQSAAHLLAVIDGLSVADTGSVFAWDGQLIAP